MKVRVGFLDGRMSDGREEDERKEVGGWRKWVKRRKRRRGERKIV